MKKKLFSAALLLTVPAAFILLSGCIAPILGGAAIGAASATAIYDRQTIREKLDDVNISNLILDKLRNDPEVGQNTHISLTTYYGTVLLVGQAPSQELKDKAEAMARSVPGIKRFYNEISIEGSTSHFTRANDSWITTEVKAKLLATKGLHSGNIKVLTEDGTVYLLGIVSRDQANLAVEATQQVAGVERVVKVFQYTQ